MKSILVEIQKDIEMNSRIDLDSDLNDINKYPDGSYSKLEHLLFKFGMVTEIPPRISDCEISKSLAEIKSQSMPISSEQELPKRRKIESTDPAYPPFAENGHQSETYWAKVRVVAEDLRLAAEVI
jgi:hypothetical protein